ncbi:MAG: Rpn family recombination-promoting nuclease/putative transposase [Candidatus Magnetoovum sp. WYHC-5]|nr:Rpn family recombination-promoting nuclease/putative transposase [Candidatus Magnetoovum sp. WYHC-5]
MSKEFDKILKETVIDIVDVLISKILAINAIKTTPITTKMQITNEREVDLLYEIIDKSGTVYILHIELQSTNDGDMPYRMLRYWVYISQIYKKPVRQCLFYIGKEPLRMSNRIVAPNISYEYEIIDFKDIDCETFLNSKNPKEIIISILCSYKGKDVTLFVREILENIKRHVSEETLRSKYIRQLEVLSQLRNLQDEVCKEEENMALIYDIERDVRFRQGLERGIEKGLSGLRRGIELALKLKFGNESLSLINKIRGIGDVEKLEKIQDSIEEAANLSEFIALAGLN